nr:group II intron maturase-specific domain-containing protein [Thermobacillus xylanilyticus]
MYLSLQGRDIGQSGEFSTVSFGDFITVFHIHRLNRFMMGWIGYFRPAAAKNHCGNLDAWIRRRLRMCLWKQWKRPKTRLRNLRALGVPEWAARMMANSRRGPWEMSRNTNNALPTSYWEAKGLKSLLSRYLELC